jgi:hypothetical protein
MKIAEKYIEEWVKENKNLNKKYTKKGLTGKRK